MNAIVGTLLDSGQWKSAIYAGLGGAIAIALLAQIGDLTELHLLIPPFGASCVLAFGFPSSPFARMRNIIGGHFISALVGLAACAVFGAGILGVSVGVGLAISSMMLTDTVHPPAGANPVVVALTQPQISFLIFPVLVGAAAIVILSALFQKVTSQERPR